MLNGKIPTSYFLFQLEVFVPRDSRQFSTHNEKTDQEMSIANQITTFMCCCLNKIDMTSKQLCL